MSDEKKTTAAAKKAAEVQEEAVVYCGPTIKGLAPQYTFCGRCAREAGGEDGGNPCAESLDGSP